MKTSRRSFLAGMGAAGATAYVSKFSIARAQSEPIRIGGQGALSGAHADYGRQMRMGATLAIEEINGNGGILGRQVELNFVDEELRPDTAVRNARQQVSDWGADFLVGVDSSGSCMAVGPVLAELDRICIFTHAATHRLTEELVHRDGIKQIFRSSVPVYQDAILAAHIFALRDDVTRWANIGADYEYGRMSWAMFKHTLGELRPDVEFVAEAWAPFQTLDFSGHVSSVMAAQPDGIFSTPWAGEAVSLLRSALIMGVFEDIDIWWQAMGGSVDVLEGVAGQLPQFNEKLYATGRYLFTWSEEATREKNREFVDTFQERWGRFPNYSAETTYSAVYSIKQACEAADSTETAAVIAALEGMEIETPAGIRTYREQDHQAVYPVPGGRVAKLDEYPIPVVGADVTEIPTAEYYRWPPFEPIPS
ncbi:MAG TPA: ABC transporter substrate-binding protein [Afifellaceae bacterium]|nr:ABC transporter substrate-binding protein [Afifellaceae bacterium]